MTDHTPDSAGKDVMTEKSARKIAAGLAFVGSAFITMAFGLCGIFGVIEGSMNPLALAFALPITATGLRAILQEPHP